MRAVLSAKELEAAIKVGSEPDSVIEPTKPWGGSDEVAWSPDGKSIAFASKPSKDEAWHTNSEIYIVNLKKKTKPRCVTSQNKAWDYGPSFSPDGKTLGYLAMDRPGYESDKFHIVLFDLKTKKRKHLQCI